MLKDQKKWYALYTKPRWEKKVDGLLQQMGIESYCPLNRVRKKWSDRLKWVEEPLFRSYIFVHIADDERPLVRMVSGIVNFVYWMGKPAIVKDKEIRVIRKFLNDYEDVRVEPMDLNPSEKVKIRQGVLMDREARVIKVKGNRVQVAIESIGYLLVALIDKSNLVRVKNTTFEG